MLTVSIVQTLLPLYLLGWRVEQRWHPAGDDDAVWNAWFAQLDQENDNVRAALQRALERGDANGALELAHWPVICWELRGYWSTVRYPPQRLWQREDIAMRLARG